MRFEKVESVWAALPCRQSSVLKGWRVVMKKGGGMTAAASELAWVCDEVVRGWVDLQVVKSSGQQRTLIICERHYELT